MQTKADSDASSSEGRVKLLSASFGVLCITFFTIVQYCMSIGPERLVSQTIRFCLTLWLLVAVYRGSQAARWISILLIGPGAILMGFVATLPMHWLIRVSVLLNVLAYLNYLYVILWSRDVQAFLEQKRAKSVPSPSADNPA